ncbi:hypothetical protein B9479_006177 [Cryptococcus floricola]|uniref:Uncharacterized protein n=1 Tax=Cryptococcus floricola TaxID=2591691 RepID=A0A5D3ASJ7_9TREE|nr:hypothetical protein B9479_006177 [Cryptococcus floricola]
MSTGDSAMDTTVSNNRFHVVSLANGWQSIERGDCQTSQYRRSKNNGSDDSTAIQLFGTIDGFEGIINIEITDLDHEEDLVNQSIWTETALSCLRKPGVGEIYDDLAQAVQETYYYASDEERKSHRKFIRKELATIYKTFVEPNQSGASSAAASPEEEDTVMED